MTETMQLKDAALWQKCLDNNSDPYGSAINNFANHWALLMEAEIANGATVADCAKATADQADTDGITGFMYGAAVATLAAVWVHGEDLRRWHNRDSQIRDEGDRANESGGVLNPAVLSIS
jgi:hypothetical protein